MSRRITFPRVAFAAIALLALAGLLPFKWIGTKAQTRADDRTIDQTVSGLDLIINEVDSDTPGTDVAEFVELYDGGLGNTPLDGYVVVFYNGSNDLSYAAFDLDGFTTNANGYFVLGNSAVTGVDLIFSNSTLQNGPDAVALFSANAADFPTGSPITSVNIRDALVYSNTATIDSGLLALLNAGQTQINENGAGTGTTVSMQRIPNGSGGARNTSSYQGFAPTPDGPNLGPTAASVSMSGRITDAFGMGIRNAILTLEGNGLPEPLLAATGSFGYYRFGGLATGTYMVTVNAKRHRFAVPTRIVTLSDNVVGVDFVADPQE